MKKLLMILAVALIGGFASAQETVTHVKGNATTFAVAVEQGYFEFKMPSETSEKELSKTIGYYKDYFVVKYSPKTNIAQITMVDNTPANRQIVKRFLISNRVNAVEFDGAQISLDDFFTDYM